MSTKFSLAKKLAQDQKLISESKTFITDKTIKKSQRKKSSSSNTSKRKPSESKPPTDSRQITQQQSQRSLQKPPSSSNSSNLAIEPVYRPEKETQTLQTEEKQPKQLILNSPSSFYEQKESGRKDKVEELLQLTKQQQLRMQEMQQNFDEQYAKQMTYLEEIIDQNKELVKRNEELEQNFIKSQILLKEQNKISQLIPQPPDDSISEDQIVVQPEQTYQVVEEPGSSYKKLQYIQQKKYFQWDQEDLVQEQKDNKLEIFDSIKTMMKEYEGPKVNDNQNKILKQTSKDNICITQNYQPTKNDGKHLWRDNNNQNKPLQKSYLKIKIDNIKQKNFSGLRTISSSQIIQQKQLRDKNRYTKLNMEDGYEMI